MQALVRSGALAQPHGGLMKRLVNVIGFFALAVCLLAVQLHSSGISLERTPLMFLSQILLLGVVLFHLGMNLFDKRPSFPDSSVVVFEIIFLIIAPSLQLAYNQKIMVNTKPFDDASALQSNLIFIVFIISYLGSRFLVRHALPKPIAGPPPSFGINYAALIPVLAVCVIAAASAFRFAQQLQTDDLGDMGAPFDMIRSKLFYFLIVPVFILVAMHRPKRIGLIWIALVLFAFVLLLLCENPAVEKRNALGPIYLTLLSLLFRRWLRSPPRVFWSIFVLSGLFFPVAELFTNSRIDDWATSQSALEAYFEQHFTSTTYDAWANTDAIVEIVAREGFFWGKQITGALLFFVPHTVWPDKPLATAIVVGEYLSRNYSMWFLNLSAPFPAEGYIDFGWPGVVLYGVLLGYFSRRIDLLIESVVPLRRAMGFYLSFYMMFVLRGSLMVAVAYVVPVFVTFEVVSFVLTARGNGYENSRRSSRPIYGGIDRQR